MKNPEKSQKIVKTFWHKIIKCTGLIHIYKIENILIILCIHFIFKEKRKDFEWQNLIRRAQSRKKLRHDCNLFNCLFIIAYLSLSKNNDAY